MWVPAGHYVWVIWLFPPSLRATRSNPSLRARGSMDCFVASLLAMTIGLSSRNLVHYELVGDAAQGGFLLDRPDRRAIQDSRDLCRFHHRLGEMDFLRRRQALHPGCDIH